MKTVMLIIDGLGDEPIAALAGRTPLECAFTPNIRYIANRGQIGRIATSFPGFPVDSVVCIMGLLGYEPERFWPGGRAAFEGMARGIPLLADDLVLRCNTVAIDRERGTLRDFTAGMIADSAARSLISRLGLPDDRWLLYPGQSYRNTLIIRGASIDPRDLQCREPHMHVGAPLEASACVGTTAKARDLANQINTFVLDTRRQIAALDFEEACTADMLWAWSPSSKPVWPVFTERSGWRGALVGGLDFLHGMAMAAGIHFDKLPGATGYTDTDYAAKAECTIRHLRHYDFVLTHVNAADEAAHQHDYRSKIKAIETIDRSIVGPVLYEGLVVHGGNFRIVVCGDHGTRCSDGNHTDSPVPFALFGRGILSSNSSCFSERACAAAPLHDSLTFLKERLWAT